MTVIVIVVVVAQSPAVGVNVYVVVAVLFNAGLQVPVMPLVEVVGNADKVAPEHISATWVKVGVTFGLTVTVKVVVVAHWPASGVKVYVPLTVLLITAGAQVPVMPLSDVKGSIGATEPSHIAATGLKVGVTFGKTVISIVVIVAHCPASGVKVYVPPTVLLIVAGDQVPVIPLVDVNGNTGAIAPEQIGAMAAKVGVRFGITVISRVVAAVAHCPAAGVKVYVVEPVVAVLITAGDQVPVMPLLDVAGNAGAAAFRHSGPMVVKAGVICASMITFNVVVVAHSPAAGVKVYVVVPTTDVLIKAGLQVPVMPLIDVNGNAGATELRQSEPNGLNVGVTFGVTVTSTVVDIAH